MKQFMVILGLMVFAAISQAAPTHVALCAFVEDDLVGILKQDIKEMSALTPFQDKMTQQHLLKLEYTDKVLTFKEIQNLFTVEYKYDELVLSSYRSQATGRVYHSVVSYPGDNQYGLIFDSNEKLVAEINDGDITLLENGQSTYCYDLEN